jgi:hypothetical protein
MRTNRLGRLVLGLSLVLLATSVFGHHGGSSLYDLSKVTTLKATITQFVWSNPHCEIFFDATDDSGKVKHWVLEVHPPNIMTTRGWNRKVLAPGDVVTISFHPGHNDMLIGTLIKFTLPDGREFWQDPPNPKGGSSAGQ